MDLVTTIRPSSTKLTGEEGGIVAAAGQVLTIETSPGGAEILQQTVPVGKQWTAHIAVSIDEVDA